MAQHMPSGQFEGYQEHLIYGRPDQQNMQNDIQHSNSRRLFVLMIFTFVFCIISNLYLFYDRSNLRSQMYDLQQQIDNLENKMVVKSDNTIAANITTHHDTILDMQRLQNESSSGQNKNSKQNCTYSANSVRNINISALQTQVKVINESVTQVKNDVDIIKGAIYSVQNKVKEHEVMFVDMQLQNDISHTQDDNDEEPSEDMDIVYYELKSKTLSVSIDKYQQAVSLLIKNIKSALDSGSLETNWTNLEMKIKSFFQQKSKIGTTIKFQVQRSGNSLSGKLVMKRATIEPNEYQLDMQILIERYL
eukprot:20397_1